MKDVQASQPDTEHGGGRQVGQLLGRESEMEEIRAFLATTRLDGEALFLTGEPGVGKTVLLNAASAAATSMGTRVLRAAGVEFEAGTSFSGLNQVLLPILDQLSELPAVSRNALNVALGFGDGAPPSRLVVSNATLLLLRHAAASRPVLVILDDLPWLDRASAGVLSFVARRLASSQVALLGASRTGEVSFFDHSGLHDLEVLRLDDVEAGQLLDSRYPELASAVRERILDEAQGNPLALLELPVALGAGMRASAKALPSALPLSRRLQTLFRSRIAPLPARTRHLLLRMALDGTGDVRVLANGATSNVDLADLAAAEQARVAYLDEAAHRLAFHHPLIRSAVVDLSQAEERRAAHRALADVWADQPERRAWHLGEATVEPDESVAAQLEAAAARILARGDAVGCVKILTRASELSPRSAERELRLAAAAYVAAQVAGDLSNASSVLGRLRRGEIELEGSLQAAIAASSYLMWGDGDVKMAHRLLVGAIQGRQGILDAREPLIADALITLLMVCSWGAEASYWQAFKDAIARTQGMPLPLYLLSKILADPARADAVVIEALDSAIAALADESDPTHIVRITSAATYVDRVGDCLEALRGLLDDARRGGAVASGMQSLVTLAAYNVEAGQWDEAEHLVNEALRLCDAHGYQNWMWTLRYHLARIAAVRGDYERVHELTTTILQWTVPRGMRSGHMFTLHVRALAAAGRGDFEDAFQLASGISPPGVIAAHVPKALYVLIDLVEAAVRTGRNAEAAAHVAAMHEAGLSGLSPRLALVVGGSTAMIATDDSALELFDAALSLGGIERWPFDLARVRLAYGERLRRGRAMSEARVQLSAALDIFERLRARPWVDRASAELRATGQTKPRASDYVLDRLTPQEFEVVTLAAKGQTNKQIAEKLFLSARTVGGHLHRAFPKLGVETRAALRDALQSLPPERLPRK